MKKIILIHGRSQQGKSEAQLKSYWIDHLLHGFKTAGLDFPDDVRFEFPYYGDLLIDEIKTSKTANNSALATSRGPESNQARDFVISFYNELLENAGKSPGEALGGQAGQLAERGLQNLGIVRKLAKALDNGGWLGDFSLHKATADVFYYLNDGAVRQAIDEKVSQSFDADTVAVIGHSLGSVVAYNVLSQNNCLGDIRALITVGSPLGLRAIKKALSHPLRKPVALKGRWYNFFDPADIVALRPLDKENFNISPSIFNDGSVTNGYSNHHGIENYIGFPEVAKVIHNVLKD